MTEKVLVMFDTDGTLEIPSEPAFSGPIKIKALDKITNMCEIFIVSESPFYPKNDDGTPRFPLVNKKPSRWLNLTECIRLYTEKYKIIPQVRLYVSDNGDIDEARKAGVTYIKHTLFLQTLKDLKLI